MAKAKKETKIFLELTEEEACDIYIHMEAKYHPSTCNITKEVIREALGYTPKE